MSVKYISYLELWKPFCSAEQNHLCNSGSGFYEEQFCETILNSDQSFKSSFLLKIYLIWSSVGPFVQRIKPICAISVEDIKKNNSVKLF